MITPLPSPALAASAPVRLDPASTARFNRGVAERGVALSRSSVGEWVSCPARWAFRAIERQSPGPVGDELRLGRACHLVVAELLVSSPSGDLETHVARALDAKRVPAHLLPSAVYWVLWAYGLARQRGGRIVAVERSVRTQAMTGTRLSGRIDLVVSGGSAGALELVDWTFGRHPRFSGVEQMALDPGVSIYRTLLAVAMPERPDQVVITDVHVPERQVLSVELKREQVQRAWRRIQEVRDGMRAVGETGV
ncbi:MAG: PD-(D/E)XK nuclease family protein, partial [Candidatus Dormibacteraeota bacterium]|nr:PD-(D/E)XK nuclease family protein [Candidatus Dormibacteraeota bacterium]